MSFLKFLVERGLVQEGEIEQISSDATAAKGGVDEVLARRGIDPNQIRSLKSSYYGVPEREIDASKISSEVLRYFPEESARHYSVAPIGVVDGSLEVGIVDPDDLPARDAVRFIAAKHGMPFRLYLISQPDFNDILIQYRNLSGEVSQALGEITEENVPSVGELGLETTPVGESADQMLAGAGETKIVEDAPVTKIVQVIMKHAVEGSASDVHIEHMGDKIRVRFRVDGVLYSPIWLPPALHSAVVARIKIIANLKLDEKRKPQDGRVSAIIDGRKIDFRVSTFPAYYGEKVVLRILDSSKGVRGLDQMGLSEENLKTIREALNTPYGLILITGPTGSGKSTTLYSMLSELDREKHNVISLEDPVEYNIAGVSQSQVRAEIGYTFANGLRSILRQDPDIIMVGEIRDKETAQLAVQAALTGHLVFSTLHTNTAAGVIPRLIDMEVDPYLIAPTLVLAIGQRLVRTFCPDGKKAIPLSESRRALVEKQFSDLPPDRRSAIAIPDHVYEAQATPSCPSGTKGRMAVYEMLKMDRDLEHIILSRPVEQAVYEAARAKGFMTMRDDALFKAFQGTIPFEEINAVMNIAE